VVGDVVRDVAEQRSTGLIPRIAQSTRPIGWNGAHLVPEPCVSSANATVDLRVHAESHLTPKPRERLPGGRCRRLFEGEIDGRGSADVCVAACGELGEVLV